MEYQELICLLDEEEKQEINQFCLEVIEGWNLLSHKPKRILRNCQNYTCDQIQKEMSCIDRGVKVKTFDDQFVWFIKK